MSVRNRLITVGLIVLCLGGAAYSGVAAQKTKAPAKASSAATVRPAAKAGLLNLNTATVAELDALPSIGPKTAARIVEFRQKIGGFKKIEQLMNVKGVGEKNFLKLKDRITVGPVAATGHKP